MLLLKYYSGFISIHDFFVCCLNPDRSGHRLSILVAASDRADVRRLTLVIDIRTLVLSHPSTLNSLLINFLNQLRNIISHL